MLKVTLEFVSLNLSAIYISIKLILIGTLKGMIELVHKLCKKFKETSNLNAEQNNVLKSRDEELCGVNLNFQKELKEKDQLFKRLVVFTKYSLFPVPRKPSGWRYISQNDLLFIVY